MTEQNPILVTGATGTVGGALVSRLLDTGLAVRALARDPAAAELPAGVEVARGDFEDLASLSDAVDGVRAVFLVWPFISERAAIKLAPKVVDTIARHTGRVVYVSPANAAVDPDSFWARVERLVERADCEFTVLRPTGFAKNTLMWAEQIRRDRVVRWPYGLAARSLIDERDIAEVAVRALIDPRHAGATYTVSGAVTLTQIEQVHAIAQAIDRPLRWEEVAPKQIRPGLVAAFGDESFADRALRTWAEFVTHPEATTGTVEAITGAPARTLRDWATHHAQAFL